MNKIKGHMYWMQGWDNAPPRALRNYESWKAEGFDITLWDDTNVPIKFHPLIPPAMRCDITLSRAQFLYGGLGLGADMSPINADAIKNAVNALPKEKGYIVWQSLKSSANDKPYNGGSYFPKENKFIEKVWENNQKLLRINYLDVPRPVRITGPYAWKKVFATHRQYVKVYKGSEVFLTEPRVSAVSNNAWLDAGFAGDNFGNKPEVWE